MSVVATVMRELMALGVTGDALVAAVERIAVVVETERVRSVDEAIEKASAKADQEHATRKAANAKRTQKWREARNVMSPNITAHHGDAGDVSPPRERAQVVTPSLPSLRSEELEEKKPVRPSVSQSKKSPSIAAFDRFWLAYPRKIGKADARKAFDRAWRKLPAFDEEKILAGGLERAKAGWVDPQFIPHAATWLNGERWTDEPDPQIPPGAIALSTRPKSREEINREGWDYAIQKLAEEEALGQPSH